MALIDSEDFSLSLSLIVIDSGSEAIDRKRSLSMIISEPEKQILFYLNHFWGDLITFFST